MRQILISSAKSLFSTLSGYILHPILVLDAVQARPLISNAGNALQQVLQTAFRGTHFVKWLSYRSTIVDVQGTPFWSKKGWNSCTLSTVEPPLMSCVQCRKNSQQLLSHLYHRIHHFAGSSCLYVQETPCFLSLLLVSSLSALISVYIIWIMVTWCILHIYDLQTSVIRSLHCICTEPKARGICAANFLSLYIRGIHRVTMIYILHKYTVISLT